MTSGSALTLALSSLLWLGCSVSEPDANRVITLPFWVSNEFTPSGYMGDGSGDNVISMHVDDASCHVRSPKARGACFRFDYQAPATGSVGWGGVYFQAPPNNWGSLPGKRVAPGARTLRLLAAGAQGGELATFRIGGLTGMDANGEPYPYADSFQSELSFPLTTELVEYSVPFPEGASYDRVLGGFAWTLLAPADVAGPAQVIFLDDIHWE
jgi:hypothetical protein